MYLQYSQQALVNLLLVNLRAPDASTTLTGVPQVKVGEATRAPRGCCGMHRLVICNIICIFISTGKPWGVLRPNCPSIFIFFFSYQVCSIISHS